MNKHRAGNIAHDVDASRIDAEADFYLASEVDARIAELEKFVREAMEIADRRWFTGYRGEYNDDAMIGLSIKAKELLGLSE